MSRRAVNYPVVVSIRLTAQEAAALDRMRAKAGWSRSDYLRGLFRDRIGMKSEETKEEWEQ